MGHGGGSLFYAPLLTHVECSSREDVMAVLEEGLCFTPKAVLSETAGQALFEIWSPHTMCNLPAHIGAEVSAD